MCFCEKRNHHETAMKPHETIRNHLRSQRPKPPKPGAYKAPDGFTGRVLCSPMLVTATSGRMRVLLRCPASVQSSGAFAGRSSPIQSACFRRLNWRSGAIPGSSAGLSASTAGRLCGQLEAWRPVPGVIIPAASSGAPNRAGWFPNCFPELDRADKMADLSGLLRAEPQSMEQRTLAFSRHILICSA